METPESTGVAARTLSIERLDLGGAGLAVDGTQVRFTLPGERARVVEAAGEATLSGVLEPSPNRVPPACRHFGTCGGCALQHANDAFLRGWKEGIVRRALAARGLAAPFRETHISPPGARRRAVFAGRRTRKGTLVGFRAWRSHAIVPVEECPVSRPALVAALPTLADLTGLGASRSASLRLAVAASEGGIDVAVDEAKPLDGPLRLRLAALAEASDLARLAWNGEVVAARRPAWHRAGRALVEPPPGGFLQATADGAAALVEGVAEAVGDSRRVLDLFAGSGTFALPLAERAAVHAVEGSAAALVALDAAWRRTPGLRRITTEVRDLVRRPLHAADVAGFDAVVIDPPRAGAEAQARALAAARPARVAAISCNPVTFARDAALLAEGGLALRWLRVVDQFRWSPHIELVAAFSRD